MSDTLLDVATACSCARCCTFSSTNSQNSSNVTRLSPSYTPPDPAAPTVPAPSALLLGGRAASLYRVLRVRRAGRCGYVGEDRIIPRREEE
jgi:hypothetical protein